MRRLLTLGLVLLVAPAGVGPARAADARTGATATGTASGGHVVGTPAEQTSRYIVVFTDAAATRGVMRAEDFTISRVDPDRVETRVARLAAQDAIEPIHVYTTVLPGFSAKLTEAQVADLRADPTVAQVVRDRPIRIAGARPAGAAGATELDRVALVAPAAGQTVPTGIRRIRADESPIAKIDGKDQRVPGNVAVLDTGISDHPDLNVAGGHNCTENGGPNDWRDHNGHGTHVSGTIGAIDNGRGVVGVAPGVRLWAVKVLNDQARGFTSWFVCGLDWVAQHQKGDGSAFFTVVNMSVSGDLDADDPCGQTRSPYQAATCRVVASGTPVVVAAGNKSRDARFYRPAAYDDVITVSALADFDGKPGGLGRQADICPFAASDQDDTFADFSNFGLDVDLIAPGKCIFSTYLGGGFAWMSGTSMATPHVTGAVVLYRAQYPAAQPLQTKQALEAAGGPDWRTGTDPDDVHEPLLRVSAPGEPPTFDISIAEPVDWLGRDKTLGVPVDPGRRDGHREPIRLTAPDLPKGVTALPSEIDGKTGVLRLRSDDSVESGEQVVQVRATDGELRSSAKFTLRIDGERPTAGFDTPDESTKRLTTEQDQALAWTEHDTGGSGLAGRTVQHQTAAITDPGSCQGVTWEDDGSPITGPSPAHPTDLEPGLCHRWHLRVTDGARNLDNTDSGTVLVDTEPPPAPDFSTDADGTYVDGPHGALWFASAAAGSLVLHVRSVDPHSGTAQVRTTALDPTTGWQGPGAGVSDGDEARLSLSWAKGAPASSLRARATDRVGLVGSWATLDLLPDADAPRSASWVTPESGSFAFAQGDVTLAWSGGGDDGSGLDPRARITRKAGAVVTQGTCDGVSYAQDGAPALRSSGDVETGLADGTCYRWTLVSLDRVGNEGTSRTSGVVLVDGSAPSATFGAPLDGGGTLFSDDGKVTVAFSVSDDGGSGLDTRRLQRQVAQVPAAGTCDGATWKDDGSAVPASRAALKAGDGSVDETGLSDARCYRWLLVATDHAGNRRQSPSAAVLVDTDAPPAARVAVASGPAWAAAADGPVWYRSGSAGAFVLRSLPRQDDGSGVAGTRFGSLSPSAGWTDKSVEARFVDGRPADRGYEHDRSAADGSLDLVTKDRAGNTGPTLTVELRADGHAPSVAVTRPGPATTVVSRPRVVIEFTAHDADSGVASRRLQGQRAKPDGGKCTGVAWHDKGKQVSASSGKVVKGLEKGWCYRWRLTVRDNVGNSASAVSGPVRFKP